MTMTNPTNPTNEQQQSVRLIRDSVEAVFPTQGSLNRIRELRFRAPGFDPAVYRDMCGLGWAGLRVPEQSGGTGLGISELCAVAQGLGAALVPEPILAAAVAARFLSGATLASVLRGELVVIPAWQEQVNSLDPEIDTTFEGGRVHGRKRFVPFAEHAHAFLVSTRSGIANGMALVRRDATGVTVTSHITQDGGNLGEVSFDAAAGEAVEGSFAAALEDLTLSNAHYLLGAMERIVDITLAYLGVRQQFGKPIGSFQVLQHRAVDLKIQLELTRAVLREAAALLDHEADPRLRAMAVSRAAARSSEAAMFAAREAIQLHGAIGMTDECDVGLYTRKVLTLYNLYGSAVAHRKRYLHQHQQHGLQAAAAGAKSAANEPQVSAAEANLPPDYNAWDDAVFHQHVRV